MFLLICPTASNYFDFDNLHLFLKIELFKSLRNSKKRKKGNFTLKSNSNKIMLCGGGGQLYLVLNKISIFSVFMSLYNF